MKLIQSKNVDVVWRGYQAKSRELSKAFLARKPKPGKHLGGVVVVPVAGGKSWLIASDVKSIGTPVVIIQPNDVLLLQNKAKYEELGGKAVVYCAGLKRKELGKVIYGTLGSLIKIAHKLRDMGVKHVIVDEVDRGFPPRKKKERLFGDDISDSQFVEFLGILQPTHVLGYTATPCQLKTTKSGWELKFITRQLPRLFSEIISIVQIQDIHHKYWANIVYDVYKFDRKSLKLNSTGKEYTDVSIKKALADNNVNRAVCYKILQLLEIYGREDFPPTLIYVDSLATAKKLSDWCNDVVGIRSLSISGDPKAKKTRKEDLRLFKSGIVKLVVNYGVLVSGFDYPGLIYGIMARPTNSFTLFYQIIGRIVRPHPDGSDACFVDFCGNVEKFGKVETIEILNLPYFGWAVVSGGFVITNVQLDIQTTKIGAITNSYLKKKGYRISLDFGDHRHKWFSNVNSKYLSEQKTNYIHKEKTRGLTPFDEKTLKIIKDVLQIRKCVNEGLEIGL